MTMSTQTLLEASRTLAAAVLLDTIQILDVDEPVTQGAVVTRTTTPVGQPIPGLVQTTTLANAVESQVENTYSIKVARGTQLRAGQAVRVVACGAEPDLVGKTLFVDKVSGNGLAMIRKAVATDFDKVNQQGKEGI
jgi:hypothetical protein